MLLKAQSTIDIRGLHSNTIYKRDKSGLHNTVTYSKLNRDTNGIEGMRRYAFAQCLEYIKYNYTDEFRNYWQHYGSSKLQWNQKFIGFNINRLIEGKPILRYPTEGNIVKNGNFDDGMDTWVFSPGVSLNNYTAHYHYNNNSYIQQPYKYFFTAPVHYKAGIEIISIRNAKIRFDFGTVNSPWYTTKGWKTFDVNITYTGYYLLLINFLPLSGTGDAQVYNISLF